MGPVGSPGPPADRKRVSGVTQRLWPWGRPWRGHTAQPGVSRVHPWAHETGPQVHLLVSANTEKTTGFKLIVVISGLEKKQYRVVQKHLLRKMF